MLAKPGLFKHAPESAPATHPTHALNAGKAQPAAAAQTSTTVPPGTISPSHAGMANDVDATHKTEVASSSRLIVGPDVKLKGAEILDCDTLVVEGRVEATMDSRVIQIAVDGAFTGKVGIDVAEVYGRFDGELTARSQLIIHSTGQVSGKIRYGKILVEEGGELSGDVAAIGSENAKGSSLHIAAAKTGVGS